MAGTHIPQGHDVRLQSWSYRSHRFAPLTASITLYLLWFLVVDAGQLIARVWMRLEELVKFCVNSLSVAMFDGPLSR